MDLETLIRQHVSPLISGSNGWYKTRCAVCDDHHPNSSSFKGFRGNFLFEDSKVIYSCFNCDFKTVHDSNDNRHYSSNNLKLLESFGIPENEYNQLLIQGLSRSIEAQASVRVKEVFKNPKEISLPEHFYLLSSALEDDKCGILAKHYLKTRNIDPQSQNFYISTGEGVHGKKWKWRVIIPFYKDNLLIFYQGRALLNSLFLRYESPAVDKSNILYNFDEISTFNKKPILIFEGVFDAMLVSGIALNGKNITASQAYWLNKTPRRKIIIPDREAVGKRVAHQALDLGWSIALPDIGAYKDISSAWSKYGKIFIIKEIMSNIHTGGTAKLMLDLWV